MMNPDAPRLSRRNLLTTTTLATTAMLVTPACPAFAQPAPKASFAIGLNTSTIREQKLGIIKEIELASKIGYTAMEPWLNQFSDHVKAGGKTADIKKAFSDNGITCVDVIAFAPWLMGAEDDGSNAKNMEQMKRDMDLSAQCGSLRIAASPSGAFRLENFDMKQAAARYRKVLEIGQQVGILPMLEFWGPSKALSTLSEALYIASLARHPQASILTDVYHLHRGNSGIEGLKLVQGNALPVMHINDYPGDIPREKLEDKNRMMPGDGVAPITDILKILAANGATTALSLEIFSTEYWKKPAEETLKIGYEKIKAVVAKAMA